MPIGGLGQAQRAKDRESSDKAENAVKCQREESSFGRECCERCEACGDAFTESQPRRDDGNS